MECKADSNKKKCTCSYPCGKRGICCDCIHSHLMRRELPGCCFPKDAEKTYDRSFEHFARLIMENKV